MAGRLLQAAVAAAIALGGGAPPASAGDLAFAPGAGMDAGAGITSIEGFRADADADEDLLIRTGQGVSVARSDGEGGFDPATSLGSGLGPVAAEVTGDGRPDILHAINQPGPGYKLVLRRSEGAVDYGEAVTVGSVDSYPHRIRAADADGDGHADLLVSTAVRGSQRINVLLGDGMGGFSPPVVTEVGVAPPDLQWLDFTPGGLSGDSRLDLAVFSAADGSRSVWEGAGGGRFVRTDREAFGPLAADLDLDGDSDLLDFSTTDPLTVLANRAGSFEALAYGPVAADVDVGQVDGDGFPDAVGVPGGRAELVVWRGRGDGVLHAYEGHCTPAPAYLVTLADLDGDGDDDVVQARDDGDRTRVDVLLSSATAAGCPTSQGDESGPSELTARWYQVAEQRNPPALFLAGRGSPGGHRATAYFEYGPTPAYGQRTAEFLLGREEHAVAVPLPPGRWHFRLRASSVYGSAMTEDAVAEVRRSWPALPVVSETGGTVDGGIVRVSALVQPRGASTAVELEYGSTPALGFSVERNQGTIFAGPLWSEADDDRTPVEFSRLRPAGTTLHYRVVAVNTAGRTEGPIQSIDIPGTAARPAPGAGPPAVPEGEAPGPSEDASPRPARDRVTCRWRGRGRLRCAVAMRSRKATGRVVLDLRRGGGRRVRVRGRLRRGRTTVTVKETAALRRRGKWRATLRHRGRAVPVRLVVRRRA